MIFCGIVFTHRLVVINMNIEKYKEDFLKKLNEMTAEELTAIFKEVFGEELDKKKENKKDERKNSL